MFQSLVKEPVSSEIQKTINSYPLLTPRQERDHLEILSKYKKGKRREQARMVLLNSNLRLVVSRASYYSRSSWMPINDLISEGIRGMLEAIDMFDLKYQNRLSTIATYQINLRMLRSLQAFSLVYVPPHIASNVRKCKEMEGANRLLSEKEIMDELKITKEALEKVNMARFHVVSLNDDKYTNKSGEGVLWEEVIADIRSPSPRCNMIGDETREILNNAMRDLTPKEREIIGARFYKGDKENLRDIGRRFSCTSEAIRQIETKALKKLRYAMKKRHIRGSYEIHI